MRAQSRAPGFTVELLGRTDPRLPAVEKAARIAILDVGDLDLKPNAENPAPGETIAALEAAARQEPVGGRPSLRFNSNTRPVSITKLALGSDQMIYGHVHRAADPAGGLPASNTWAQLGASPFELGDGSSSVG
jgi:hypothetical protein